MTFNVSGAHQSDSVIHIHRLFFKLFSIIGYYKILTIVPSEKKVNIAQSHLTLCDPMHYTVHGILQARILEWVVFPFSRRSSNPGIEPRSPALQAGSLPAEPQGKPFLLQVTLKRKSVWIKFILALLSVLHCGQRLLPSFSDNTNSRCPQREIHQPLWSTWSIQ